MKSLLRLGSIAAAILILCPLFVRCKASAATNKREFKKELHRVERAH